MLLLLWGPGGAWGFGVTMSLTSGKDTDLRREETDLRSQVHTFKQVLSCFSPYSPLPVSTGSHFLCSWGSPEIRH